MTDITDRLKRLESTMLSLFVELICEPTKDGLFKICEAFIKSFPDAAPQEEPEGKLICQKCGKRVHALAQGICPDCYTVEETQ